MYSTYCTNINWLKRYDIRNLNGYKIDTNNIKHIYYNIYTQIN